MKKPVRRSKPATAQTSSSAQDKAEATESNTFFGLRLDAWVGSARPARQNEGGTSKAGQVFYFARRDAKETQAALKAALLPWQLEHLLKSDSESLSYAGKTGPVFILRPPASVDALTAGSHGGRLEKPAPARARDQLGALVPQLSAWKLDALALNFIGTSLEEECAGLTGMEIGAYSFQDNRPHLKRARKKRPRLLLRRSQLKPADIRAAADLGLAVNFARHLTNLPASELNPATYSEALQRLFSGIDGVEIEVWSGERLIAERMNLLAAVGQGAEEGPRLVHIRYRPKQGQGRRPLALVGKGITFDSGGLDIKPSSAMRWMKKDMGGSASAAALAYWAARTQVAQPLDVYLALAENAVSQRSFRPGDIITARNGTTVEIHNTDAEGRLVLADALDLAVTRREADEPLAVINLATLTGACRVALGAEVGGLFSNHDTLAAMIESAAVAGGEYVWRLPLFQPYKTLLKSHFAEMANASDGFAGAITAALFLERFVGKTPWAHFDIYCWRDSASGAYTENGGNGQSVQTLAQLIRNWAEQGIASLS